MLCLLLSDPVIAQAQECPLNSHYTGTSQLGNVKTIHCECNIGYEKKDGACQVVPGEPGCVRQAGLQLKKDREEGCARVVGRCFDEKSTPLTVSALGCVVACRQVAACAIGCGVAGLAAEGNIESCIDQRNDCFEAALAKHKAAVKVCQSR